MGVLLVCCMPSHPPHFKPQLVFLDPISHFLASYQASLTSSHLHIPLTSLPQHILHPNPHQQHVPRPSSTSPLLPHVHQLALLPLCPHRPRDGLRDALLQHLLRCRPAHQLRLPPPELSVQKQRGQLDLLLVPPGAKHSRMVHHAPESSRDGSRVLCR